ncbi:MAG: ATP-dependent DNA helicase [Leptospirales bacterium]|nr:ATP-dependent DNA helicase [Leptospirales bacterium]
MAFPGWEQLADFLPGYRYRETQERLSDAIGRSLLSGNVLISEAGTGTGKTLAYLIPLISYAIQNDVRVAVSTDTRSLQSQLIEKDIPLVERVLGTDSGAELCLGASNYICKRKLAETIDQGGLLLAGEEIERFLDWEKATSSGIRSDYTGNFPEALWGSVTREADNCLGRRCSNYDVSYYFVAREKWKRARLLVVNHALLANHFALDGKLLPELDAVVIDEGHRFPQAVSDALAQSVVLTELGTLLRQARADLIGRELDQFRKEIDMRYSQPVRLIDSIASKAAEALIQNLAETESVLRDRLKALEDGPRTSDELRTQMLMNRLGQARNVIENFLTGPGNDHVHWIQPQDRRRGAVLNRSPLKASDFIREAILSKLHSTIFTSATLSTSGAKPFSFFSEETGAHLLEEKKPKFFKVSSPFDYPTQSLLFLPSEMAPPTEEDRFLKDCATWIDRLASMTEGGAFALFTSRVSLAKTQAMLMNLPVGKNLEIISQIDRGAAPALRAFQESERGLLLGLATFWQGIDIPGDKLRLVILSKLPFQVPDDPVLAARMDAVRREGRSPFSALQLPHAVLSVKQGFGRLIRRETDRGVVAILDSRLGTSRYGAEIVSALPPARIVRNFEELSREYSRLFEDSAAVPGR